MAEDDVPVDPVEIDLSKTDDKDKDQKVETPEVEEQDDGAADLQRQLQAAQQAVDAANKRSVQEQQLRVQAQQQARASNEQGAQAQYDAILNGIGAAQAEAENATHDLEIALEAQDAKALAAAQRRIARAETNLTQLEDGKNAFEMRQEQYQQQLAAYQQQMQQRQQQPQRQPTVTESIDANPNFLPEERAWLKSHPEVLTNPAKNAAVQHAFFQATQSKGLARGTKEYFDHMNRAMGYTKKSPVVAAPPSREPVNSGEVISGSRVTLSPQQREAAKLSGISEVDYARNLVKMRQAQKNGQMQP